MSWDRLTDDPEEASLIDGGENGRCPSSRLTRSPGAVQNGPTLLILLRQFMSLLLVGSVNAHVGIPRRNGHLQSGGSAIDAVVATIRQVEANPDDHSVGFGGLPNLEGEVELDASIMDGRTLATGAVAALQGYQDAIALARVVMDELPHVLVGWRRRGRLASEAGFQRQDLLTPEARASGESPFTEADPQRRLSRKMRELAGRLSRDPERPHDAHGTVNVIARDAAGNLASGVSTSGWAWKFPGRVGDSPIIGAGNYADNRWGAATCTGSRRDGAAMLHRSQRGDVHALRDAAGRCAAIGGRGSPSTSGGALPRRSQHHRRRPGRPPLRRCRPHPEKRTSPCPAPNDIVELERAFVPRPTDLWGTTG